MASSKSDGAVPSREAQQPTDTSLGQNPSSRALVGGPSEVPGLAQQLQKTFSKRHRRVRPARVGLKAEAVPGLPPSDCMALPSNQVLQSPPLPVLGPMLRGLLRKVTIYLIPHPPLWITSWWCTSRRKYWRPSIPSGTNASLGIM